MEVLVEARKEYTEQLCYYMIPVIIQTMADIYNTSQKMEPSIRQFQVLLQEVKQWNQTIVKQHADEMIKECPWFSELLTAVMVAHVKILSSVRLGQDQRKISIKMPTNELFVHSSYINCAKNLYGDPHVFFSNKTDGEKEAELTIRFKPCIEQTIRDLVPIQQILTTYIGAQPEPTMEIGVSDAPDPDVEDTTPPEEEPQEEEESFFDEEKTSDESKWIGSGNQSTQPPQQQLSQPSTSGLEPTSTETSSPTPISSNQPSSMQ
jgi:hypothetical protein